VYASGSGSIVEFRCVLYAPRQNIRFEREGVPYPSGREVEKSSLQPCMSYKP